MRTSAVVLACAALAAGLGAAGCEAPPKPQEPAGPTRAEAVLEARSGSRLSGRAVFARVEGNRIRLRIEVEGVEPGLHATHIHEHADCSAPDAGTAGGHWNPTGRRHGRWGQADGEFHLGDLGNIEVGADGKGSLEITTDLWTMGDGGPADIVGRSVIVHAKPDDFTTQPTGAAGDRIGCGPIAAVLP